MEERIYSYDGSFQGLLSAIFASYTNKEIPADYWCAHDQRMGFPEYIPTQSQHAARVLTGLEKKAGKEAADLVRQLFLTAHAQKELLCDRFIRLALQHGPVTVRMLTNNTVDEVVKAVHHLNREAHLYKGFVRFTEHNGVLTGVIAPKNFVLPLIAPHFCDRYAEESFFLLDETHDMAVVWQEGKLAIVPAADYTPPEASESEQRLAALWKSFYNTIAIKERYNPRCRMSLMPKRYWAHMTELATARPKLRPAKQASAPEAALPAACVPLLPEKAEE